MKMHPYRIVLPLLLFTVACGPSQSEYDTIASERTSLERRVSQLESELDELRNGAPRRLGLITSAFEAERYDEVVSATRELAQRHPGSAEATQALRFSRQAESRLAARAREAEARAEATRREAEQSERDRVRSTIRMRRIWTSNPNSAGGVDLHIVWQNTSNKTVKYAHFTVEAYNAVGDPVSCTIRDYSAFTGQFTGPVPPGGIRGGDRYWDSAWYNSTIVRAKLTRIQIEYTDGSTAEFSGDQARLALS